MNPRPAQLDDAGASDGDVLTYSTADGFWTPAPPAGGAPSGAAGGDLAGTYPNPTIGSAGMEAIRDMLASVIVAGSNATVTVNDAGDTITIASTGGYTDEQVRDVIGTALVAGSGMTVTVNDGADTITLDSSGGYTDENARDAIGTALVAGTGITITVNDGADTITVASTAGGLVTPDDPALFGTDLGFDYEFNATTSSLPSGWAWVNQASRTYGESLGAGYIHGASTAGDDVAMIVRSLSGAPSTWTLTLKTALAGAPGIFYTGLVLRSSSDGKISALITGDVSATNAIKYNSPTSFNGNYATTNKAHPPNPIYMQIVKNSGTSYDFRWSPDGRAWHTVAAAQNVSAFHTIDQFGVMYLNRVSSAAGTSYEWIRLR